jgi:two-component system OmpR family sensor kinase
VLRIQDTGPGVSLEERERIFDPFYRRLGNDQIGAGLALSIVKAIADRVGAEVGLTSGSKANQSESGLCVAVLLPTTEPAAARRDE